MLHFSNHRFQRGPGPLNFPPQLDRLVAQQRRALPPNKTTHKVASVLKDGARALNRCTNDLSVVLDTHTMILVILDPFCAAELRTASERPPVGKAGYPGVHFSRAIRWVLGRVTK